MGSTRARIAIDAMVGIMPPAEIVTGALRAREELGRSVASRRPQQIEVAATDSFGQLEIVPSEGTIEMHEEPLSGIKRKPKASINVAMDLETKRAEAVVSAGHLCRYGSRPPA